MKFTIKSRKTLVIAIALAVALSAFLLLLLRWWGTWELRDFNKHSSLDHALGHTVGDLSDYEKGEAEKRGATYYRRDGASFIDISQFPDVVFGSPRVTTVALLAESENADLHVLGVSVGDNAQAAFAALEAHGYKVTHSNSSGIRAVRGKIFVSFTLDENGKVTGIAARIEPTNLLRVQY